MKYYIIQQSSGDWDSYTSWPVFVTESEEIAKQYCLKGNGILDKYKKHFTDLRRTLLSDYDRKHPLKNSYCEVSERADFVIGQFSYTEIEYRHASTTKA